jgi:nucleotide-binding universal stress UspA family protein
MPTHVSRETAASSTHARPRPRTHRILVCVDLSTLSEVCVPHAVSIAKTFGSDIYLVHVMEPRHEHIGQQRSDAVGWEITRQEAQAYLERLGDRVSRAVGYRVGTRLEQGRPAERLVDLARELRELRVDLSVLASRGEGGGSSVALGSTVQQVLSLAQSSVYIVHSSTDAPVAVAPKRIVVPLDGSPRSESVLPAVARIAVTFGAEILLVHIVQEPLASALLRDPRDMALATELALRLESAATRYLVGLQHRLAHETPAMRTLVLRHAHEYRCLLEVTEKEQADLVVLSAHGEGCDSTQSFGSAAAYLLTHSAVPLMVLQDLPVTELHSVQHADEKLPHSLPRLRTSPERSSSPA